MHLIKKALKVLFVVCQPVHLHAAFKVAFAIILVFQEYRIIWLLGFIHNFTVYIFLFWMLNPLFQYSNCFDEVYRNKKKVILFYVTEIWTIAFYVGVPFSRSRNWSLKLGKKKEKKGW